MQIIAECMMIPRKVATSMLMMMIKGKSLELANKENDGPIGHLPLFGIVGFPTLFILQVSTAKRGDYKVSLLDARCWVESDRVSILLVARPCIASSHGERYTERYYLRVIEGFYYYCASEAAG